MSGRRSSIERGAGANGMEANLALAFSSEVRDCQSAKGESGAIQCAHTDGHAL
jgi:hypothetical protein